MMIHCPISFGTEPTGQGTCLVDIDFRMLAVQRLYGMRCGFRPEGNIVFSRSIPTNTHYARLS